MLIEYDKYISMGDSTVVYITAEATIVELENAKQFIEIMPHNDIFISVIAPNSAHIKGVTWLYFHNDTKEVEMPFTPYNDIAEEFGADVVNCILSIMKILKNEEV